jgi:hypothetical protein
MGKKACHFSISGFEEQSKNFRSVAVAVTGDLRRRERFMPERI